MKTNKIKKADFGSMMGISKIMKSDKIPGGGGGMLGKAFGMKKGGTIKKAKAGAKFDLNKDGKTTFKDVLIGRGVLPKKAKSGIKMKKAQTGTVSKKFDRPDSKDTKPVFSTSGVGKNVPAKNGKSIKKCKYGCK
jgi:hypothetical protein